MEKAEKLRTLAGNRAYSAYKIWLRLKGFGVASAQTFKSSKFFNGFVKFQEFCEHTGIPDSQIYIKYMVDHDYPPFMWTMPEVYQKFLIYYDGVDPEIHIKVSMRTMGSLCRALDCEASEVMESLTPIELVKLIKARKLSPWLMLCYPKFYTYLSNRTTPEERILFKAVINSSIWEDKMKTNSEKISGIKKTISDHQL